MKKLGHFLKIPLAASLAFGCLSTSSVFGAEAPQSESQPISSNQVDPPNVEYTDSDNPFDHLKPEDNILPLGVCQIFCVNPFLVVETFGRFVGSKHLAGR